MLESPSGETVLVFCADPGLRQQAITILSAYAAVEQASDAESARRLYRESTPDLVVLDGGAAAQLSSALEHDEHAPPVIVLGYAGTREDAFARLASAADLTSLVEPSLRYRRLQKENKLIREESERIHGELLKSYGAVAEHSQALEEEVKRRTVELRHYADDLERQVDERTRALQESNAQLVQQEKMAALGALVAGIAHDINTPIGTITSNSDILTRSLARLRELIGETDNPDLKRVLGIIEEISRVNQIACDRIIGIIRSLRNFARLDEAEVRSVDLHEGIDSTLTLVRHELKNRITVKREYGDIPQIQCHPNQLNQVFMNMLVNASHAIPEKGTITIRTFRDGDRIKIRISDTGTGIKPENLPRIFDPGFTTKGAGVGTGLGLAICCKIIQEHNGKIDVESELGCGTTFTISLPVEWKASG